MKPEVVFPDTQRDVVDLLTVLLDEAGEDLTVSVGVPSSWQPTSQPHIEVAWDGTPTVDWPVAHRPTIRLVARAGSTSEAKRLAALSQGLLVAHNGSDAISSIVPLLGVLPAHDPDTNAEIASVTVRVTARSEPASSGS